MSPERDAVDALVSQGIPLANAEWLVQELGAELVAETYVI